MCWNEDDDDETIHSYFAFIARKTSFLKIHHFISRKYLSLSFSPSIFPVSFFEILVKHSKSFSKTHFIFTQIGLRPLAEHQPNFKWVILYTTAISIFRCDVNVFMLVALLNRIRQFVPLMFEETLMFIAKIHYKV